MNEIVQNRRAEIEALCRTHDVSRLWLFGSASHSAGNGDTRKPSRFDDESDVDFLVEIDRHRHPLRGFSDPFWQMYVGLEKLFDRRVDLVELKDVVDPGFAEELRQSRELIYDVARTQAAA